MDTLHSEQPWLISVHFQAYIFQQIPKTKPISNVWLQLRTPKQNILNSPLPTVRKFTQSFVERFSLLNRIAPNPLHLPSGCQFHKHFYEQLFNKHKCYVQFFCTLSICFYFLAKGNWQKKLLVKFCWYDIDYRVHLMCSLTLASSWSIIWQSHTSKQKWRRWWKG